MINLIAAFLSLIIAITPASNYICDGKPLKVTIRNNLNGDFKVIKDIDKLDVGSFVVINWNQINLMLPILFNNNEVSFSDKKWIWSYQDKEKGLHLKDPRFAQRLNNGDLVEHSCIEA